MKHSKLRKTFPIFLMRKFKINKLVRDKVPDLKFMTGHILSDEEYILALKKKLVEEALEVMESQNNQEMTEELGDVFEVIDALMKTLNISKDNVTYYQIEKRNKKGGFENKFFAEYVEFPETEKEWIQDALSKSDKYPEIK